MISVNQGIGSSIPEKLEEGGTYVSCKGGTRGRPLNKVEKFNAGGDTIEGTMDLNLRLYSEMYLFSNYHLFFPKQSNSLFQVKIEN